MRQICKFNKSRDITAVVPDQGVNVVNAIETGVIPDKSVSAFHNGMQELSEVGSVVREPFDVIEYDRAYAKFRSCVRDKVKKE